MTIADNILTLDGILQLRGGTKAALAQKNQLLGRREVMIETDTGRMKTGDGIHRWLELPYTGVSEAPNDGKSYIMKDGVWEAVSELVSEVHRLTEAEITAQGFDLQYSVAEGTEDEVMLFAAGKDRTAGEDFSVQGKKINWSGLGLAEVQLKAGKNIVIHYEKG